jgi:D-aminoacyl-tRNA deacylase
MLNGHNSVTVPFVALGLVRRADEHRPAIMLLESTAAMQSVSRQFGCEFICLEPVFARMHGECAKDPRVEHVTGDFLEQQKAAGSQHAGDLTERLLPVRNVVNDPEIHDGVHGSRWQLDVAHIADRQRHRAIVQSSLREFDHGLVEVECRHIGSAETIEDDFGAHALATADFEHVLPRQVAAGQSLEPRRLAMVLMCRPYRVVHQCAFDGVELHGGDDTPMGYRPKVYVGPRMAASAVMRILVQRVTSASVTVDGEVVGAIAPAGQGLLALVGITHTDDATKAQRLAEKLWQLRILDGEKSASDVGAPILVVSQFTLYANTAKGRRPTWNAAAPGAVAEPLVTAFAEALRSLGAQVETGVFGADMQVALVNDGPVTVLLDA